MSERCLKDADTEGRELKEGAWLEPGLALLLKK